MFTPAPHPPLVQAKATLDFFTNPCPGKNPAACNRTRKSTPHRLTFRPSTDTARCVHTPPGNRPAFRTIPTPCSFPIMNSTSPNSATHRASCVRLSSSEAVLANTGTQRGLVADEPLAATLRRGEKGHGMFRLVIFSFIFSLFLKTRGSRLCKKHIIFQVKRASLQVIPFYCTRGRILLSKAEYGTR